jgi:hypothetical protein
MRRRQMAAAVGVLGGAALATGIIVASSPGSSKGASPAGKVSGATTVQRRDLVATDTESGTLGYASPQTVFNRLTGTITSLPSVGALIRPGHALYRVDGAPVTLFNGSTPAYRDLTSGDTDGSDILELNRDLRAMGFDSSHAIALNDTWQAATTTAVEAWQNSLGETETGTISLGQVVFLPGPQRITTIDTTLGSTGGASGASTAATGASLTLSGQPHAEFVGLATVPTTTTVSDSGAPAAPPATTTAATTTAATTTAATTTAAAPTTTATTATTPTATPGHQCNGVDVPQQSLTNTPERNTGSSTVPNCNVKGSGKKPSTEAVLLALLKAETLELKKSLAASGSTGRTGTSTGLTGGGSRGGGGGGGSSGNSGSGGGGGGGFSAASGGGTSSGASSGGSSGSGAASAEEILQTTSTQVIVSVDLDATKQSEATVGEPVTVEMPNGKTLDGKITQVSPVAESSSSSSSSSSSGGGGGGGSSSSSAPSATIPVTIALKGKQPGTGLDQAAVSVNFEQQVEKHVLSVPVTALLATAGGGYAVQEAAAPHRLIPVTPGLFAAGYVQITSSQIYPGLQVTDSQG